MSETPTDRHPDLDEFMDYFASRLTLERESWLEHHLSECDDCTQQARQVYSLGLLMDRWCISKGLESSSVAVMDRALETLINKVTDASWRERLKNWAKHWSGKVEGVVRITIESPTKAARIITDGLDELLHPSARWQFISEPEETSSVVRGLGKRARISVAIAPGTPQGRVAVMSEMGRVEVRIDNLPEGKTPPLVVLVSIKGEAETQVRELKCPPGGTFWIAMFEDIKAGEYLVVLEPME